MYIQYVVYMYICQALHTLPPVSANSFIPVFQVCTIEQGSVYFFPTSHTVIPLALTILFQLLAFVLMLTRACT